MNANFVQVRETKQAFGCNVRSKTAKTVHIPSAPTSMAANSKSKEAKTANQST
jgi:hypothetical protein